jgi:hypothetical protein
MSFAEQYLMLSSAEQDPGVDKALLSHQAQYQPRNKYSGGSMTPNQNPASRLSPIPLALVDDEAQWDEILLEEFHRDIESQDPNNRAGLVLGQRCACFTIALTMMQQLCQFSEFLQVKDIGRLLDGSSTAIKNCEQFSSCHQSCHQKYILLYLAVLEQVDNHYSSLRKQIVSNDKDCQKFTIEVMIGSFTLKTGLTSDIGKALLRAETKRALVCTRKLAEKFRLYVEGGCTAEVKCQQEILSALAESVEWNSKAGLVDLTDGALSDTL